MEKSKLIEKLFYYIVAGSYLLLPIYFLFSGRNKRDIIPILLALYGIVIFSFLMSFDYVEKDYRKLYQALYTFVEYLFFALLIYQNLKNSKFKKFIIGSSALFFLFQLLFYFNTKASRLDSLSIAIETILIFIYVIFFFYDSLKNPGTQFIYNNYCFWLSTGMLIYLAGSFFFFILINQLSLSQVRAFGDLTYTAEILKNLLFVLALYIYSKYPIRENKKIREHVPYLDMI